MSIFMLIFILLICATFDGYKHINNRRSSKLVELSNFYERMNDKSDSTKKCYEIPDKYDASLIMINQNTNEEYLFTDIVSNCDLGDSVGFFEKIQTEYDYNTVRIENIPITFEYTKYRYRARVKVKDIHITVLEFLHLW